MANTPALIAHLESQPGPDPLNPAADLAGILGGLHIRRHRLQTQLLAAERRALVSLVAASHAQGQPHWQVLVGIRDSWIDQAQAIRDELAGLSVTIDHAHQGIDRFCEVL